MKSVIASIVVAAGVVFAAHAADPNPTPATPLSEGQRIDSLLRQNELLVEEIRQLRLESERPKTKEEAFAACTMAAESIGGHCDLLLKK